MAIGRRINKDGTITYQVKVKGPGGGWVRPIPSFRDLREAERCERELMRSKRARGSSHEDGRTTSVREYWAVWRVENRGRVSEGWKISQDQMFRDYIEPVIGHETVAKITTPLVGKCLTRMRDLERSDQLRLHVYSLLNSMFRDAVEYYGMIYENPVKAKFHRPKVVETERDFLTPEQSWTLLEAARGHEYLGPAIWLQVLSAMRPEAIQGLSWSSVLWDLNQILIRRAWKQKVGEMAEYPKGRRWEYVPMPPALKSYLLEKWAASPRNPEGFVCPGKKGGMLPYETYLHALRRLCAKAGVPVVTPHELRHSSTELYIRAGASQEDIRRLLNHRSLSATRRYIHRTDERLQSIAGNLGGPGLSLVMGNFGEQKSSPYGEQTAVRENFQTGVCVVGS